MELRPVVLNLLVITANSPTVFFTSLSDLSSTTVCNFHILIVILPSLLSIRVLKYIYEIFVK
jgi:hypothetical protein